MYKLFFYKDNTFAENTFFLRVPCIQES